MTKNLFKYLLFIIIFLPTLYSCLPNKPTSKEIKKQQYSKKTESIHNYQDNKSNSNTSPTISIKAFQKEQSKVILFQNTLDRILRIECIKGNKSRVIELLEEGANANSRDSNGDTPLYLSTIHNNYEVIKILLIYGANPYLKNKQGISSIDIAKEKGYEKIYNLLIRKNNNKLP